jgi:hypothetical protein
MLSCITAVSVHIYVVLTIRTFLAQILAIKTMHVFGKTGRKTTRFCLLYSSLDMKKRVKLSESLPFLSKNSRFFAKKRSSCAGNSMG